MKTKLLNIRFLVIAVFFVFAFMLSGQDYNSLETKFYEAIERNDHEAAIQYGQQLMDNYKQNTAEDSTFATTLDKVAEERSTLLMPNHSTDWQIIIMLSATTMRL